MAVMLGSKCLFKEVHGFKTLEMIALTILALPHFGVAIRSKLAEKLHAIAVVRVNLRKRCGR